MTNKHTKVYCTFNGQSSNCSKWSFRNLDPGKTPSKTSTYKFIRSKRIQEDQRNTRDFNLKVSIKIK